MVPVVPPLQSKKLHLDIKYFLKIFCGWISLCFRCIFICSTGKTHVNFVIEWPVLFFCHSVHEVALYIFSPPAPRLQEHVCVCHLYFRVLWGVTNAAVSCLVYQHFLMSQKGHFRHCYCYSHISGLANEICSRSLNWFARETNSSSENFQGLLQSFPKWTSKPKI